MRRARTLLLSMGALSIIACSPAGSVVERQQESALTTTGHGSFDSPSLCGPLSLPCSILVDEAAPIPATSNHYILYYGMTLVGGQPVLYSADGDVLLQRSADHGWSTVALPAEATSDGTTRFVTGGALTSNQGDIDLLVSFIAAPTRHWRLSGGAWQWIEDLPSGGVDMEPLAGDFFTLPDGSETTIFGLDHPIIGTRRGDQWAYQSLTDLNDQNHEEDGRLAVSPSGHVHALMLVGPTTSEYENKVLSWRTPGSLLESVPPYSGAGSVLLDFNFAQYPAYLAVTDDIAGGRPHVFWRTYPLNSDQYVGNLGYATRDADERWTSLSVAQGQVIHDCGEPTAPGQTCTEEWIAVKPLGIVATATEPRMFYLSQNRKVHYGNSQCDPLGACIWVDATTLVHEDHLVVAWPDAGTIVSAKVGDLADSAGEIAGASLRLENGKVHVVLAPLATLGSGAEYIVVGP